MASAEGAGETPSCWDGAGLRGARLGIRRRRKLGLVVKHRVGRVAVSVQFWSAADAATLNEWNE